MTESKTAKARAWHFPTSPRSPYKLHAELKFLKQFDGRIWDKKTQLEFAQLLKKSSEYQGDISKKETAFAARDRTRGPKLLGFICIPKRGSKGKIEFTDAGNLFLSSTEVEQEFIFERQIAKVQFKSHLHNSKGFENMDIRPLTLMIKLLLELKKMSKIEIALFALTLTDYKKFDSVVTTVRNYRNEINNLSTPIEKKIFRQNFAINYVNQIYAQDINAGRTKLREGGHDFSETKLRTLKDYADSTIRYLRATGLFTLSPHGQTLELTKAKLDDSLFLLDSYGLSIAPESNNSYDLYIKNYLGNPSLPLLRKDNSLNQLNDLNKMVSVIDVFDKAYSYEIKNAFNKAKSHAEKLIVLTKLEQKVTALQIKNEALKIRSDFNESLSDILKIYSDIASRDKEVIDRPLMYEWNTWRSMVLLNDALNVQGNYLADADGNPVSTASGGKPDALVEYSSFWLALEVTLQRGMKQYETEGEPVTRHVGKIQKDLIEINDSRPVFGLFIAEKINEEVISHFFISSLRNSQVYKGKIQIVPMERKTFELLLQSALKHSNFSNYVLLKFFENCFSNNTLDSGELDWFNMIAKQAMLLHEL